MSTTPTPDPLSRAFVLLSVGRTDYAEKELREAVREDPSNPVAQAALALVLSDLERYREAEECARAAIVLDPELPLAHSALARALAGQRRFRAAVAPTREAIRLDPEDHLNHELLAACQLARGKWYEARASAEEALRLEPESATALGLRAAALAMSTDDPDAWRAEAAAALAADPGSSAAHALAAHAHLTRGHERHAVEGFEEALRLDPESPHAQWGLAEALKAAHPVYRPIFRFYMWQARLTRGQRAALIIVPFIAVQALRAHDSNPFVLAVLIAWFSFVVLTWIAVPVANLVLRLSPRGRAVLPVEQRRSSSLFAALIGGCVLSVVLAVAVNSIFAATAFVLAFLALAVGSRHGLTPRRQRMLDTAVGLAVAAAFLGAALLSVGAHAGVFPLLAAGLAGLVLIWFVRFA